MAKKKPELPEDMQYEAPWQQLRTHPDDIDWKEIHDKYVRDGLSISELAGEYAVSYYTLRHRAYRENWSKHKKSWRTQNPTPTHARRKATREVPDINPDQTPEEDKKSLDRTHSIAIQKLGVFMNEVATSAELAKLVKALIELRESDNLSNIERTQLTIDIPEEFSE